MNIAIIGYGSQGASAYEYWSGPEHSITICDKNTDLSIPKGAASRLGDDYLDNLNDFDLIIRSPSIHPNDIEAHNSDVTIQSKVTTNTNEFFKVCPSKNIIGVTGTKGKGTTSTLITRMLEAAGKRVHLGGNIGTPPLEMLKNGISADDWVVLELANFQLIDLKYSPTIAVCLNVVNEHIDWHTNEAEYYAAKSQLFAHQAAKDVAIYYAPSQTSLQIASKSKGRLIPFYAAPGAHVDQDKVIIADQILCSVQEIGLLGKHNWQNVCAAVTAVWNVTQDTEAIKYTIVQTKNLPFRTEKTTVLRGVNIYNDSFATAPDATLAAANAVTEEKVLMIGGYDRGNDLEHFALELQKVSRLKKVVIYGQSADRIAKALTQHGFSNYVVTTGDFRDIVSTALEFCAESDALVFSPGFASFDMFKNFEDRGIQFNNVIEQLQND